MPCCRVVALFWVRRNHHEQRNGEHNRDTGLLTVAFQRLYFILEKTVNKIYKALKLSNNNSAKSMKKTESNTKEINAVEHYY